MIGDLIGEWIKGILIDGIMGNLSGLFNTVNTKVGEIASDVGSTPQDWNGGIFSMLQNLSETVIVCTTGESERGISRCTDPGQYPTTRCIIRRAGKRNSRRTLSLLGGQPGGFS